MITNLTIRAIELDDAQDLKKNCWPDQALPDIQLRIHRLRGLGDDRDRGWGYAAVIDGEVVGFGQLMRWGHRGEICNLIVAERWRSTGIGSAIIRRLIGAAREHGLRDIEIGAAESNPRALALYRRLGFRDDRHVTLDLGDGMESVTYLLLDLGRGICEA